MIKAQVTLWIHVLYVLARVTVLQMSASKDYLQVSNIHTTLPHIALLHPVPKKLSRFVLCQNFVKFPPILIIFGRKMGNYPNICEVHSFSTSPNLYHHLTLLNVPNCYITLKLLVLDRSHWRPQFNRGRRTFQDHSNFRQFVHI